MGSRIKRRVTHGRNLRGKAESAAQWRMAFLFFIILSCIGVFCMVIIKGTATAKYNYSYIHPDEPPAPPPSPAPNEPGRLTDALSSADALAKKFLDALTRNDVAAIKALRVTKEEFCGYVWPELRSSKVPNLSCDFAWDQATLRSLSGLGEVLSDHEGKKYELIAVRFAGGRESYRTYNIHKDARLKVKDERGVAREVNLFGSMLELNGQFKLFSFVID